jgi:hypothetical protein
MSSAIKGQQCYEVGGPDDMACDLFGAIMNETLGASLGEAVERFSQLGSECIDKDCWFSMADIMFGYGVEGIYFPVNRSH